MKTLKLFLVSFLIAYAVNVSAQTVYTTKTGEKYHKSTCHHLKYSKKEITLEKALELRYSPCSVCKPASKSSASQNALNLTSSSNNSSKATAESVQCSGKTQSGSRCKRITKDSSGRCYQHQS